MVKYYLAYPPEAEEEAVKTVRAFADLGLTNTQDTERDDTAAIKAADFLFVLLTESYQIDMPAMRHAWETFDNEIRWKRKPHGEILFLVPEEDVLKNLPLRLKNYGYYMTDELDDAASYCDELLQDAEKEQEKKEAAVRPVKPIVYTPSADTVKQIEFSVRAPQVKSFDGSVSRQGSKETSGCRDDHVFDGLHDTVPQKIKEEKSSKRGCAALVVLFVLMIAVVITLVIVFGSKAEISDVDALVANVVQIPQVFARSGVRATALNALQGVFVCGII